MAYGAIIGQTPTVQASAEMTSYNNDNTSSVITADNVQGAIDQLFTSVSNGKSQIASAITDMGVSTSANDSFAQMATNIGNIKTGPDWSQVQSPAGAAQILAPYQTYDSSNKLIKGTITSKGAQTYTPKTVSQTIAKGQYLSGNQTIQGDENLKANNIKSGVSIFGVEGKMGIICNTSSVSNNTLVFPEYLYIDPFDNVYIFPTDIFDASLYSSKWNLNSFYFGFGHLTDVKAEQFSFFYTQDYNINRYFLNDTEAYVQFTLDKGSNSIITAEFLGDVHFNPSIQYSLICIPQI